MPNNRFYSFLLFGVLFMGMSFLQAQSEPGKPSREQIESMRIAFYTREMNLSPAEATLFWPIYNQFKNEEANLRKKNPLAENEGPMTQLDSMTEEEAAKLLDQLLDFSSKENALKQKYTLEIAQKLSRKKALQFIVAERNFRKELLRKVQERRPTNK